MNFDDYLDFLDAYWSLYTIPVREEQTPYHNIQL